MSKNTDAQIALNRIGHIGKTSPPTSQDPFDFLLHEYHITSIMASYATKRKKAARDAIENTGAVSEDIDNARADVIKHETVMNSILMETENYSINMQVKTGASYFDLPKFKSHMLKTMTTQELEEYMKPFMSKRTPAVVLTTSEK